MISPTRLRRFPWKINHARRGARKRADMTGRWSRKSSCGRFFVRGLRTSVCDRFTVYSPLDVADNRYGHARLRVLSLEIWISRGAIYPGKNSPRWWGFDDIGGLESKWSNSATLTLMLCSFGSQPTTHRHNIRTDTTLDLGWLGFRIHRYNPPRSQ